MIKAYTYPVIFALEDTETDEGDFPVYIRIPDLMDAGFSFAASAGNTEDDILAIASDCMKMSLADGLRRDLQAPIASKLDNVDLKRHLSRYDDEDINLKSIAIEWIKTEV
ncbi:hypothetical protein [Ureibacillus sinduriensis]|uniref:HicB-like antitoxin of toxin-antitoxin system domain-containing protein n=1 Tax=Ureibacillus sinduriensis BLB-1 = JCM 15800 TaxID=1384057 RepID=A0A0A3I0P4_9BACL|nr:hypothetical protein [Ureibacillus sinduriensis]KGR77080.1 hypothetical protein CD33_04015 [Ureibacillus sinduriensis BLB-1 = JCM 15800]